VTVGQVVAKLSLDTKEYEKGLRKAETQASKAGLSIGAFFKNAFSVAAGMTIFETIKGGFEATVKAAIDFNSMLQTAQIGFATMLGSAEKAQKFLEDMADFAVKTPFEYPELLEASKRMLAYGFAAEEVLPTLRAVGDASAALGSGSVGIDRITLALGQIRAKGKLSAEEMRQLTEAGIPAWHMLAEAMGTTVPALQDMVSKGLIPGYKAVEMLTAGMTKRFGGMMASMENTWQGVTSSIKDIWRMTFGTLTQTLFGGLNNMLIQVRDFMAAFYSYLQGILGKKAKQSTDALVGSTKAQAAAITEVGDATDDAAKKANKNLQAFDEVHQLQEEMSDTAAGGMPTADTAAVAPLELEVTGESEALTKIQEVFEKLAVLFGPAIEGFNRLKTAAEPVIANIGEGLKWFYDNILAPFGTWVIAEAVPSFMNLLSGAFTVLNPLIEGFKPLGQWLWDNFLVPVASWTGEAFVTAINAVGDALEAIGTWMSDNQSVVEGITIAIAAFFAAWKLTELMAFIQMSGGVVAAIQAMTSAIWSNIAAKIADKAETIAIIALYAKDFIVSLGKGVASLATNTAGWIANTAAMVANKVALGAAKVAQVAMTAATVAWNAICGIATTLTTAFGAAMAFLTSPIGLVVLAIGAVIAIVVLLVKYWDEVKAAAIACWEWIKNTWAAVAEWFKTKIAEPIKNVFSNAWQGVKNIFSGVGSFFSDVWSSIKNAFGNVADWFKNVFSKAWTNVKNVFSTGGKIFTGIKDGIADTFKNVVNAIIRGINTVIAFPFDKINGMLNKIREISFLGISPFKNLWGENPLPVPQIPQLATGTNYVPDDMLAYLHEGEAVVPKKYNPAATGLTAETIEQAVYRAFMSALRIMQASTRQDDRELVLKIDNTVLARMQLPAIIREGQRQGLNLVVQPQGV